MSGLSAASEHHGVHVPSPLRNTVPSLSPGGLKRPTVKRARAAPFRIRPETLGFYPIWLC